jgi:hypothetical protein
MYSVLNVVTLIRQQLRQSREARLLLLKSRYFREVSGDRANVVLFLKL